MLREEKLNLQADGSPLFLYIFSKEHHLRDKIIQHKENVDSDNPFSTYWWKLGTRCQSWFGVFSFLSVCVMALRSLSQKKIGKNVPEYHFFFRKRKISHWTSQGFLLFPMCGNTLPQKWKLSYNNCFLSCIKDVVSFLISKERWNRMDYTRTLNLGVSKKFLSWKTHQRPHTLGGGNLKLWWSPLRWGGMFHYSLSIQCPIISRKPEVLCVQACFSHSVHDQNFLECLF